MTKAIILSAVLLLVSACSDGTSEDKLDGDHVWKEQTQTIDKAKAVEGMLEDAATERRKIIDEQAQ
jgi:hypothetical protein